MSNLNETAEQKRLYEAREQKVRGRSEVPTCPSASGERYGKDYSDSGNAWSCFSHDQARSHAYHWGW
jgi:hypothetical protein